MTTGVAVLVAAVVLAVVVGAVVLLRNRRPASMEDGIAAFAREMRALAPERARGSEPPVPPGQEPAAAGDEPGR